MNEFFVPSLRSLYLSSLPSDSKARQQGEAYLLRSTPNYIVSIKNNTFQENKNISTALKILESAISTEKNNEQQYFTNFLSTHNIPDEEKQILKDEISNLFNSDSSFDYDKFLELVNTIIMGENSYRAILQLENQRLNELKKVFESIPIEELKDASERSQKKSNRKSNKQEQDRPKTKEEIIKKIREEYLEKHTYAHTLYTSYFNKITPTIDYLLAEYLRKLLFQILSNQDTVAKIKQQFMDDNLTTASLNKYIISAAAEKSNTIIEDLVNEVISTKKIKDPTEEIINDIVNNFQIIDIMGQGDMTKVTKNFILEDDKGQLTAHGENATNKLQLLLDTMGPEESPQGVLKEILSKTMNYSLRTKESEKGPTKITSSIETALISLEELLETVKQLENKNRTNPLTDEEQALLSNSKADVRNLKTKISVQIKYKLDELLKGKVRKDLDKDFERFISQTTVTISGPQLSEFLDTVLQKGELNEAILTGQKNAKADTIIISLLPPEVKDIKTNIDFSDIENEHIKEINRAASQKLGEFYKTFQDGISKKGNATNYAKGKIAWFDAVKKLYADVQERLQNDIERGKKELPSLESLAKIIEQSIVVTTTMKTFNNYNNEIGFLSGSLGPNLISQINNFAELFASAGVQMTQNELDWLEVAMVNCSDAAIGVENKDPIERYLSLMAGFALFDEGSAEVEIIATAEKTENFYSKHSPKIMHLYKLNGLYYPGSYILTRIREHLTNITNQVTSEMLNNDGAIIDARGDEKLIDSYRGKDTATTWKNVYNAALDRTKIRVAFLSGLLDVVNKLGNFNNMEE